MSNLPCKSDVEKWNVEQVAAYIQQMQVGDCRQAFLKRGIDGRSFLTLTETSLVSWSSDLPIKCRLKVAKLVKDINTQPAQPSKLRGVGGLNSSAMPPNAVLRPPSQPSTPSTLISAATSSIDDFSDSDWEDESINQRNLGSPAMTSLPPSRAAPTPPSRVVPTPPASNSTLALAPPHRGSDDDGYLLPNSFRATEPAARAAFDQVELNVYEPVEEAVGQRDGAPFSPGENGPPLPPRNTVHGSGDARGASSVPPAKVFPPPATKPATPVSSVSGSPLSIKPPVPSLKKEPQLPPLPSRPVVPPAKPLVQGSSSSKSTAKSPMVNTGGKPSNIGHHSFNEGLNILLRNSPASGTKGNEPLPTPSGPPLGISPAPLHLPPQGIKKPALVTSNRHSDPSASAAKSTTSTIPVSSASNILRRPAPPGGVQLFSLASPSEIQGTTDETEEPEDSQESVRLSDGSRVDLTPLYKSLVQRDFFHLVSRSRAEEMLLENPSDGAFVVRPSSKEHPLTLVVVCQGTCSNICIRQRPDRLFALGAEKHNEVVFKSVDELIEHHLQKPLKLNSGQEVLLTTSPSHHTSYVYVRMPIARLANSIAA